MKKQKWQIGDKIKHPTDTDEPFRIMAFAEGYYMARRPKAMPIILIEKDTLRGCASNTK